MTLPTACAMLAFTSFAVTCIAAVWTGWSDPTRIALTVFIASSVLGIWANGH